MPAHFRSIASPLFNFTVAEETFFVSVLVILLGRQMLPTKGFKAQGTKPTIDVVWQPPWTHGDVSMVI